MTIFLRIGGTSQLRSGAALLAQADYLLIFKPEIYLLPESCYSVLLPLSAMTSWGRFVLFRLWNAVMA
jgi:hypothetical protein